MGYRGLEAGEAKEGLLPSAAPACLYADGKSPGEEGMLMMRDREGTEAGQESLNNVRGKLFTRHLLKMARQVL